jgi:hypothetical protein
LAVSMNPLKLFRRGQWPHWNSFGGVNDPAETISFRMKFLNFFTIS